MNINRFFIIILAIVFLSCGNKLVKVDIVNSGNIPKLTEFFIRSELDSIRAGKVLEKQRIIQHLTHLRRMDTGGKKYYLLEKDDITEMINSVTEGVYLDYILINKHGDIIYTKKNNDLFGLNVNNGFEATPLKDCFSNRSGVYFVDISTIAPSSDIYSLYISAPIYVEGNFHGVLILQVEVNKIREVLDAGTEIFSRDGVIRISSSEAKIFSKYPGFDEIDLKSLDGDGEVRLNNSEGGIIFSKFSFKEINWILMNKNI